MVCMIVLQFIYVTKWETQATQELKVKVSSPCHHPRCNCCGSHSPEAIFGGVQWLVICVPVHSHECVWRLIHSDKLITYFLSYRLTSLTNKDWLPFVPRQWVFVLVPCHRGGCMSVWAKRETQSEFEKLRVFLSTDQSPAGPSLLPWYLAAGNFWSTPGGGYETERI